MLMDKSCCVRVFCEIRVEQSAYLLLISHVVEWGNCLQTLPMFGGKHGIVMSA